MSDQESLSNYGLNRTLEPIHFTETQPCPMCYFPIGALAGSKDAICKNCGYKDPCCE